MSPNGTSNFDKILIFSSSDSSDSESLLQEDIKSNENGISKQWEAIQRTLYQEPGEQVTDPELVKECKLWRETFPHFRVKGTKVDLKLPESEVCETDKNTQTIKKHFDPKKLEEKREVIKNKVVGMLVDRLVTKYGVTNVNSGVKKGGVKITEIDEEKKSSNATPKNNIIKSIKSCESSNHGEKESYFERGKPKTEGSDHEDGYISREEAEKSLSEIFDSWEKDFKSATKLPKTFLKGPKKMPNAPARDHWSPPKPIAGRFRTRKITPSDGLDDLAKPFEMTKKIDKKYDGLIDRIMERRYKEIGITRHCPTSATEAKSYQESLEKLRIGDGFNDTMKRNTMPRINKFDNNWLKRREINRYYEEDDLLPKKSQSTKPSRHSNLNIFSENDSEKTQEGFLADIKKDINLNYKNSGKRSGFVEEISIQRPKPLRPVGKPLKSSSCGDVQRKNKIETRSRRPKNGLETCKNELNLKIRAKSNNPTKKGSNLKTSQSPLLPPIECGLICTELTGRPKIGPKIPARRY